MAKRRQRRRAEKEWRHADTPAPLPRTRGLETTSRVKRIACTRKQAADALGVSTYVKCEIDENGRLFLPKQWHGWRLWQPREPT